MKPFFIIHFYWLLMIASVIAFHAGVVDAIDQKGDLSTGMSWESNDAYGLNEAYDRGVNVGEWLWDLSHWQGCFRWPWVQRAS